MNETSKPSLLPERVISLDAYRGLIMVTLAFQGFGLRKTAGNHLAEQPDSTFWRMIEYQFTHVEWVGCAYWDLIQPSFMFMVGVSVAYSYAKRNSLGHAYSLLLAHAVWRSLLLVGLGILLTSNRTQATNWSFTNVLTQIGLGYTFLFLLWGRPLRVQALWATAILTVTWLAYITFPTTGIDPTQGAADLGIKKDWAQLCLSDVDSPWHKNANVGHAVDVYLLNLLPRAETFTYNNGGYQTINFIPSIATMLFGLMAGELLRSPRPARRKLSLLLVAGVIGLTVGQVLHLMGVCPIVKRIWTPTWVIFSTGWCCLFLASLYTVIDVLKWRRWVFPFVVVGMNSIAIYAMGMLLKPWTARTYQIHLGPEIFDVFGKSWAPTTESVTVGLFFWLVCYWMFRRKIFLRL